jgi:lysophospholipase L1-like esterase
LRQAGAKRALQVQQDPRWGVRWYKDGIHPTAAGFGVLAGIVKDDLDRVERVGGL